METGINNKIDWIKSYNCGYCENNLKHMYKGTPHKIVPFDARVLLIHHRVYGHILVDTGYSKRLFNNGVISLLYNLLNPSTYRSGQHILKQLHQDGLRLSDINKVILTHLHPDHIGGVLDFKDKVFTVSRNTQELLRNHKIKDLVFESMINDELKERLEVVDLVDESPLDGFRGIDYFGDNSLWLIEIEGHAKGQMGVYLPEVQVFYVADALWSYDYIDYDMRTIPRLIQNDYNKYIHTIEKLKKLDGIRIVTTHGNEEVNG